MAATMRIEWQQATTNNNKIRLKIKNQMATAMAASACLHLNCQTHATIILVRQFPLFRKSVSSRGNHDLVTILSTTKEKATKVSLSSCGYDTPYITGSTLEVDEPRINGPYQRHHLPLCQVNKSEFQWTKRQLMPK